MKVTELALLRLARIFSRTQVAHSSEMKAALTDVDAQDGYRSTEITRVLEAARRYGVPLRGKRVLDFGCHGGAMSVGFLAHGATQVWGVDIDAEAIARARRLRLHEAISFQLGTATTIPLADASIDTVISYDVFEHVARVPAVLQELARVLAPGGQVLIGTWGWRHPFAPHLWSAMPVPWAHMIVSERTLMAVCRRVYLSDWYVPTMYDLDATGRKRDDKYTATGISTDYLNKYLIADFERDFRASGLAHDTHLVPFGSRYAAWSASLLGVPWLREFLTGYVWFVLSKPTR